MFGIRFEPMAGESWTDAKLYRWAYYVGEEVVELATYKQ
jgi:hypothetical protein